LLPREIALTRSHLRPWRRSDRAALLRYANDRAVWRNLRDRFPHPYTSAAADEWLAFAAADPPPAGVYAIAVDGEAAGTIALERGSDIERWICEVGYWLGQPFWGRGIMTEALRAVTAAAFQELDVIRIHAPVFSWNRPSMRVLEKAGYGREAVIIRGGVKDGTVIDRVLYAITRDTGLPYAPFTEPRPAEAG
jgi:[ribosomal protein S5]-alanine N-acetyltransferase